MMKRGGMMCILTHDEILRRIRSGQLKIEPFSKNQVGPASIDLHLGNRFRPLNKTNQPYEVTEEASWETLAGLFEVKPGEALTLWPGELYLGVTEETIHLPPNIVGWIQGRSKFARVGLTVNGSTGYVHPGSEGRQVLEISNIGCRPLKLSPGLAICQLILEDCIGEATYSGQFQHQIEP